MIQERGPARPGVQPERDKVKNPGVKRRPQTLVKPVAAVALPVGQVRQGDGERRPGMVPPMRRSPRPMAGNRCGTCLFAESMAYCRPGSTTDRTTTIQAEEAEIKRVLIVLSLVTVMLFATQAMSADREAIRKNVDEVVNAIDGGKDAKSYAADAFTPYVFIMEANGNLVVHPTLAGQDLKVKAMPIFEALQAATP